jgi:hypothetical protein
MCLLTSEDALFVVKVMVRNDLTYALTCLHLPENSLKSTRITSTLWNDFSTYL